MLELPDKLDAKRFRTKYRDDDSVYVVVSILDGQPVEVFAEFTDTTNHANFLTRAGWEAMTRLITLGLKSEDAGLAKVVQQLERSSIQSRDLPGILAGILREWLPDEGGQYGFEI